MGSLVLGELRVPRQAACRHRWWHTAEILLLTKTDAEMFFDERRVAITCQRIVNGGMAEVSAVRSR